MSRRKEKKSKDQDGARLKPNRYGDRSRDINILLLGQTGVGKSTFINAFTNYIVNDTLSEAVNDEMQVVVASSFSYTMDCGSEENEDKLIVIGTEDEFEKYSATGHSNTQQCRSFVFPIGDRNLRLIDTPGVGDTRSIEQDAKNFQEILNFISQYEHLNGVFILLKPNEERLNIFFRFCINELLRHLQVNASENIVFIFTNARSTFFRPGTTKSLLQGLLNTHKEKQNVVVPFSTKNTFLFDSESFRYLALRKNGIQLDNEQTLSYTRSWDHSVQEYARLMSHVVKLPLHAVAKTLSLNEAEQLIRKLSRPMAETARLIEENIALAKEHKRKILKNPNIASRGIPQRIADVKQFKHPQTVCTNKKCCQVTKDGDNTKVEYLSICHDECYLKGVIQDKLSDPELEYCEVMNPDNGYCRKCACEWQQHKHPTYQFNRNHDYIETENETSLSDIDQRINNLREEERSIRDVYTKLAKFLYENSILPINDDFPEYIQYFIREAQLEQSAGAANSSVITNLEKIMTDFISDMELFKKTIQDRRNSENRTDNLEPINVFALVGTLYRLPINGKQIRAQVEGLELSQSTFSNERDIFIELPAKASASKVMRQLKDIVSS